VLDLAARGLLRPRVVTYPLSESVEAYRQLAEGKVEGRVVVVPDGAA
jgi:D-arabinose 1-dehydrogenase-like Zn-dependent alcohol dehydrogenase